MPSSVRTLILDYGGVLVYPQTPQAMRGLATLAQAAPEAFAASYWKYRMDYDRHGQSDDYWRRVLESCAAGADHRTVVGQLIEADARSWMVYRKETWEIAAAFRATGGRTALLSNAAGDILRYLDAEHSLSQRFDVAVISGDVGLVKPDPAIYRLCLERLGANADSSLFVDDRQDNLNGAAQVGLQTLLFTGEESVPVLRARLGFPAGSTNR